MQISEFGAFKSYLAARGYCTHQITETKQGVEALLYLNTPPNLKDFTQVKRTTTGNFYWVRLGKADYTNKVITEGLFDLNY